MRLQDKVAIVTGASKGIGRAIALGYASEGAHLALAARTPELLDEVSAEIHALGQRAISVPTDVTDEEQIKQMVQATLDEYGRIDILVNNAGVGTYRPVWGTHVSSWNKIMSVNLLGPFLGTKHVWKPMKQQGGGIIINIGSLSGARPEPMYTAYAASKWGLAGFTKSAAEEGKADNIRINLLSPGKVDTPMREPVVEDKTKMLTAQDCVGTAIFLASDEAQHIRGQVIELDWAASE